MMQDIVFDSNLTRDDRLVLEQLSKDIRRHEQAEASTTMDKQCGMAAATVATEDVVDADAMAPTPAANLVSKTDPAAEVLEPTVFTSWDLATFDRKGFFYVWLLAPYIASAKAVVRHETDVVFVTHLLLYFCTSLPSAIVLFSRDFRWSHGVIHMIMQGLYLGSYTLMQHQHIHGGGILARRYGWLDQLFPYVTDPLMGHTWNSYHAHHIKHHHVEGNGPLDLSSTLRFQRDSVFDFARYVARFFFLVWYDLPVYFISKRRYALAAKAAFWEIANYATYLALFCINAHATFCVFLAPLLLMRLGLMAGNWGQHAFVDHDEPDSDYRSSITLIDVQSNRHCFNDGYHTSHHLNPRRHWRDHPNSFLQGREQYAAQGALVFHKIDYLEITIRLLMKDYRTLAQRLVPIGSEQYKMTLQERMDMLKAHAMRFTEEEIIVKFGRKTPASTAK